MTDPGALVERAKDEAERASDRLAKVARFLGNSPMHREFKADYLKARQELDDAIARLRRLARLVGRVEQAEKAVVDCPFKAAMHKLERDRLRAELAALEREGSGGRSEGSPS